MSTTHPQRVNLKQVDLFLANAIAKAEKAKKSLTLDVEVAYQFAYDAMLKGSLTLMLSHGQRPKVQLGHHRLIIEFAEQHLAVAGSNTFIYFDHMRRKRNNIMYDVASVTDLEAKEAVRIVQEFLHLISSDIASRKKSGKLK